MKKEAESRGAEEAPISGTLGMESGRGVVSMRTSWLNLWLILLGFVGNVMAGCGGLPGLPCRHFVCGEGAQWRRVGVGDGEVELGNGRL